MGDVESRVTRLDAGERDFFTNELRSIDQKTYEVATPLLKGRMLVPKVDDVGPWDTTYEYRMYESYGEAEIISDATTELPMATSKGRNYVARIKPVGIGYQYTIPEIRAAMAKGVPLSDRRAKAARKGTEQKIDKLIAVGSAEHDIKGFVNQSVAQGGSIDSTTFVPVTKTGTGDNWDNGSAASGEILADINAIVGQVWTTLEEAEELSGMLTLAMPPAQYQLIASQPIGDNSDKTILSFVLSNNPFLEDIVPWGKLAGAGDSGEDRMICYRRDPMVLGALIPMEWTREAEQLNLITYTIPTLASCGGTVIRYPIAIAYGDGI